MTRSLADLGRGSSWRFALGNRPAWADVLLARRIIAAALAVVAIVLFVRGDPGRAWQPVVVAAHDLSPGRVLTADDVRVDRHESRTLPTGFAADTAPLLGATLTGAMRAGETFTDLRVIGPRLAAAAAGTDDARIVPIRLADSAVAEVLRAGDRVDVVGVDDVGGSGTDAPARTLAKDAAVVLVTATADRRAERVVLVALATEYATAVAGASLRTALTVVFH